MVGLIVKLLLGVALFAGSLVGGLAATGRLNHEGTANIPLLRSLFPPPPGPADMEAAAGKDAGAAGHDPAAPDAAGRAADAHATAADATQPADAAHAAGAAGQEPQGEGAPKARKQKVGKSVVEPEEQPNAGGHGGGHGEAPAADHGGGHGDDKAKATHGKDEAHDAGAEHGKPATKADDKHGSPESDFQQLEHSLQGGNSQYKPGELFRFQGLPAGITPEQINEAWQRVQGQLAEIERRKIALDLREQELQELHEETGRRQAALGKERVEIEQMQRQLDAKIQKFQDQVKLVRNDEVAGLKRNAQTIASFEPAKAAELIEAQWKSERGQDEVLKLLEFMDKDAVNEILKMLPAPMVNDLMKKRMRVSKEAAAPGKGG